jgi:hypothetical protein
MPGATSYLTISLVLAPELEMAVALPGMVELMGIRDLG